jgi:hypothetical protein
VPTLLEERAQTSDAGHEVTVRVVTEGGSARRRPSLSGIVSTLVVGALAVGVLVIAGVLTGVLDIGNPFSTQTVDRTQPALLKQMRDLTRYTAAEGTFRSTVDIEDDVAFLPAFVAGERTVFEAQGTVDANVDFSSLDGDAIQKNPDGSVTVTLPEPRLGRAEVDPHASRVVARDRGIVNRVAGFFSDNPTSERRVTLLAEQKLGKAARESNLVARAERNTTKMLQGFLGKLGFENVRVVYAAPPHPGAST